MLLEGKNVVVTGGSRGIGRQICEVFAREGADVAFCYASNKAGAEATVAAIEAQGRRALAVRADVGDRTESAFFVAEVIKAWERIDVLVLNAGINRATLFLRMPDSVWDDIVRVNVGSLYNVGKPVYQQMMRQRGGSMLIISSISGIRAVPAGVPYAVTKAASVGFTKAIAREGGRLGIRANAIAVGIVETDMSDMIPDPYRETYLSWCAQDRLGEPRETAELAAFLVSDRNSYMTGEVIVQDGGTVV